MRFRTDRVREDWEGLSEGRRAAGDRARARFRSPEGRAAGARVHETESRDAAGAPAGLDLTPFLTGLRAERERQGLSLSDVSARSGVGRSALSGLELSEIANPAVATLRAYARALGFRVRFGLVPPAPPGTRSDSP